MPIPKPKQNETKKEFISRCISEIQNEFTDNKQRAAVCNTSWGENKMKENEEFEFVEFKVDIADIKNVEILDSGTWIDMSGKKTEITKDDIDEMVNNFKNGVREPILNLDHSDKLTDKVKRSLSVLSLGFVSDLKRIGTKLVADFKEVPAKLAELIKAGSLKKRSAEFFKKGYIANGKVYNNVLSAVSFFGHDAPAINTLNNDFEVIFEALMQMDDHKLIEDKQDKIKILYKEERNMDTIELKKDEYQSLLKSKTEKDSLETKFKSIEEENKRLNARVQELTGIEDELKSLKEQEIKDKEESLKKEAVSFVEEAIKNNNIQAKFKEFYVKQYIDLSSDNASISTFKEEIGSRKIELQGELPLGGPEKIGNVEYDDDKLNEQIEINMKKNGTTFEEEAFKLGISV